MTKEEALEILGRGSITTHELARALLVLDDSPLRVENHAEVWSDNLIDSLYDCIQVGLHRF